MVQDTNVSISLRTMEENDIAFILSLSPVLAGVAKLDWHSRETIQTFQDDYIKAMFAETSEKNATFIAEENGVAIGFTHVRRRIDEVSGEDCGTVPLLAVSDESQKSGAGRLLIEAAENWSKEQGYRLLHLEVFSSNQNGLGFYEHLGFQPETLNMIKPLS